jgi:hypothetical protein
MGLYRLTFKQILILILLFGLIYAWICVDQVFISRTPVRFLALAALSLGLLTGYFFLVRPREPMKLAAFISLWIGSAAVVLSVIQHVIIKFDISYKGPLIWLVAFGSPFLCGLIYRTIK